MRGSGKSFLLPGESEGAESPQGEWSGSGSQLQETPGETEKQHKRGRQRDEHGKWPG
jgi:hypothetical protein